MWSTTTCCGRSRISRCRIKGGSAGLRPAPAQCNVNCKSQSGIPWDGGALWVCGDAVNPSMGAWSPHPCGSHPANPQCPAFDRFTRLWATAAVGGCRPLVGTSVRYRMNSSTHGVALLATAAVGGCRPLVGTSVRHRMNSSTHGVDLLATAAVGRCRPLVGTSVRYRMNSSTHGVDLPCRPTVGTHQQQRESAPTRAERRSDRSRRSVEGGVGPVEGV